MTLKELEAKVKLLGPPNYYYLNDPEHEIGGFVLKYSRRKKVWEYYVVDERGGKGEYREFATEEEACEFAYNDAIQGNKTFVDAYRKIGKIK